ncbi:MAG: hypothetical protein AB1772_03490 [Candidatus Zixiibacteriota bacterium]
MRDLPVNGTTGEVLEHMGAGCPSRLQWVEIVPQVPGFSAPALGDDLGTSTYFGVDEDTGSCPGQASAAHQAEIAMSAKGGLVMTFWSVLNKPQGAGILDGP